MTAYDESLADLKSSLRPVDIKRYPELFSYSRDEIYGYGDQMAPGALFLATRMARDLELKAGDAVLDVGCGLGESSIFLARHYGVTVVAIDRWIPATKLARKFCERGLEDQILPLNFDITKSLPFADEYFDAIFCMTSFHYFGEDPAFVRHLLNYLKASGRLCVGNTCFNQEISSDQVPQIYRTRPPGNILDGWQSECSKYHSPGWWKELLSSTGMVRVVECVELEDGPIMWEDKLAYDLARANWSEAKVEQVSIPRQSRGL